MPTSKSLPVIEIEHLSKHPLFRLRIIHKGLALALIPLFVNAVWIFLLSSALAHSHDLLQQEQTQAEILSHLNRITVLLTGSFGELVSYASSGDELHKTKTSLLNAEIEVEFDKLKQLTAGEGNQIEPLLNQLLGTLDQDSQVLSSIDKSAQSNEDLLPRIKRLRQLIKQIGKKNRILVDMVKENEARLQSLNLEAEEADRNVRNLVAAGLGCNLILALILVLLLVKDIKGRLKLLVENAHLLPKHLPLTAHVGGNDELSELDTAIHAASVQLAEAAEYRRALTQMMAHDLKSPLSSCLISLETIGAANPGSLNEKQERQVNRIRSNLGTLVTLINDLLLLESLETGHLVLTPEPESVRELIDATINILQPIAQSKSVRLLNEAERCYIAVDRNRILQVLTNLVSNAIKFAPTNSDVTVTAEQNPTCVRVAVIDQGRGLSKEDASRLFQKFKQTEDGKKAGGTGLGLALAKLIVEAHGGKIGVDSEPGHGCQFWFTIPMTNEPTE